jgi:hypothetical protein
MQELQERFLIRIAQALLDMAMTWLKSISYRNMG